MADWFKMSATYPDDVSIVGLDDAAEVMFIRGLAYLRRSGSRGFIPTAVLKTLTRADGSARIKRIANQLTRDASDGSPGPWEAVEGGYRVRSWSQHNDAADKLDERLKSDAERQRKHRASKKDRNSHVTLSRDISRDVTPLEERRGEEKAAAAASAPPQPLPPALEILRSALEARKLSVRWDRLNAAEIADIEALIAEHGDGPLVAAAVRAFQPNKPAAFVNAWLPGWRDLRSPGDLHVVHPPCDQPGHSGTTKHCAQCASEQKAAR